MALVLNRRVDETICFEMNGEIVTLTIGRVTMGDQDVSKYARATVVIDAPRSVVIWRDEIGNKKAKAVS